MHVSPVPTARSNRRLPWSRIDSRWLQRLFILSAQALRSPSSQDHSAPTSRERRGLGLSEVRRMRRDDRSTDRAEPHCRRRAGRQSLSSSARYVTAASIFSAAVTKKAAAVKSVAKLSGRCWGKRAPLRGGGSGENDIRWTAEQVNGSSASRKTPRRSGEARASWTAIRNGCRRA